MPLLRPAVRFAPIVFCQTLDGDAMPNSLFSDPVRLDARLVAVEVIVDHVFEIPFLKPLTRLLPTSVQLVELSVLFSPLHFSETVDVIVCHFV